ncbi:hypothetical protein IC582_026282 [Cucumis melo]
MTELALMTQSEIDQRLNNHTYNDTLLVKFGSQCSYRCSANSTREGFPVWAR